MPSLNKRSGLGESFLISTQVRSNTQLKKGANLNKRKQMIFVTNFRKNFGRNIAIFVKNVLVWKFFLFLFFNECPGPIKCPVQQRTHLKAFVFRLTLRELNQSFRACIWLWTLYIFGYFPALTAQFCIQCYFKSTSKVFSWPSCQWYQSLFEQRDYI